MQVTEIEDTIKNGGNWPGLVVAPTLPGRGRGVLTTRPFHQGEVVCHYNGDLVDDATGRQRYAADQSEMGYMYTFRHKGRTLWLDATEECLIGPGRLLNHSRCHANVSLFFFFIFLFILSTGLL